MICRKKHACPSSSALLLMFVVALTGCGTRFPETVEPFDAISVYHADSWTDGGTIDLGLTARRGTATRKYWITLATPFEGNAAHKGRLPNRIYLNGELVEHDSTEEQNIREIVQQIFFWSAGVIEIDDTAKDSPNFWERPPFKSVARSLAYQFLKSYSRHSRDPQKEPTPYVFTYTNDRPENGFYVPTASKTEPWIEREDIYNLSSDERREISILESDLTSLFNANTEFELSLTVPYHKEDHDTAWVILVVDGTAYRGKDAGCSIAAESVSYLRFRIDGMQRAKRVSKYLGTPVLSRKDPQHSLVMSLTPSKERYPVGEEVSVSFRLSNDGTNSLSFIKRGPDYEEVGYSPYRFSAKHGGEPVKSIMEPPELWIDLVTYRHLFKPGDVIEDTLRLNKWFAFDSPGLYDIEGSYHIEFMDPSTVPSRIIWEEHVKASCSVRISRENAATE